MNFKAEFDAIAKEANPQSPRATLNISPNGDDWHNAFSMWVALPLGDYFTATGDSLESVFANAKDQIALAYGTYPAYSAP